MTRAHWLFVSKPLEPPLRDGSQVLVSHLLRELDQRFRVSYFGAASLRAAAHAEALHAPRMQYSPSAVAKLRLLATLLAPRYWRTPMHFFFTPNRLTSTVLALLKRLAPRRPIVQSLMSSAGAERHVRLLAPLDSVVVLSRHTQRVLLAAGVPAARVHCIYPAVPASGCAADRAQAHRVLYAGDLDERVVDRLVHVMRGIEAAGPRRFTLTVACRPKAERDAEHRRRLARLFAAEIAQGSVELCGEVSDMNALWRTTALQVFAADHVTRKVDLPFVLLEGLAAGVPLVALDFAPVNEIFDAARRHALDVGAAVAVDDAGALERTVRALLEAPERLERAGADACRLAQLEFSLPVMAGRYADLYDRLENHSASLWQPSRSSAG
jgi:glycosyltransferase involved in cell wall biosynthesis